MESARAQRPAPSEGAGPFPGEVDVCRQFAPRLRALALRHLRDRAAADDVVQEVLASVVVALREGRIERAEHLTAYVLSACRRRISDVLRTDARRSALRDVLGDLEQVSAAQRSGAPDLRLDLDRVVAALGPLSGRERQVLNETFAAGRSAEEIAHSIGITTGHVRVLRCRALAKLRAALGWKERS